MTRGRGKEVFEKGGGREEEGGFWGRYELAALNRSRVERMLYVGCEIAHTSDCDRANFIEAFKAFKSAINLFGIDQR